MQCAPCQWQIVCSILVYAEFKCWPSHTHCVLATDRSSPYTSILTEGCASVLQLDGSGVSNVWSDTAAHVVFSMRRSWHNGDTLLLAAPWAWHAWHSKPVHCSAPLTTCLSSAFSQRPAMQRPVTNSDSRALLAQFCPSPTLLHLCCRARRGGGTAAHVRRSHDAVLPAAHAAYPGRRSAQGARRARISDRTESLEAAV